MQAGNVLELGRAASPQFVIPIRFRVIRVTPAVTADGDGWVWLDGYQLAGGQAVERRSVFVLRDGVKVLDGDR